MLGATVRPYLLAVDRQHAVARAHVDPRRGQGRGCVLVGRVALHDHPETIDGVLRVVDPVDPQEALVILGPLAVLAPKLIGVRRAELALHLPEEIRELGARGQAIDQRQVALIDAVPVDA